MEMNRRYVLLMLLLLIVLIGSGANVATVRAFPNEAEKITLSNKSFPGLTMTYSYGYNFYGKYGRQIPVFAEIRSTDTDFQGWLEVSIPLVENGKIYRKEIILAAGESIKLSCIIPLSGGFGQLEIKLVDENTNLVLESLDPIKLGNYEKILFAAVLTDSPDSLKYVDNLEIKPFLFNNETFPDEVAYLDMFDILVINDFDTSLLNDNQVKAIKQWVLDGGSLVLGSGQNAEKVIPALSNEFEINMGEIFGEFPITAHLDERYFEDLKSRILRFEEERNVLREQISNRNKQLSSYNNPLIPLEEIPSNKWPTTYIDDYSNPNVSRTLADVSFVEEETQISQKSKKIVTKLTSSLESGEVYPVYQRKELGKGNIILYTFDLSINGEIKASNATFAAIITTSIIGNLSDSKQMQVVGEQNGSSIPYSLTNSMSYTDTENIPRVAPYIAIIVIYILLIGPISYLILHKRDKHSLIWIVVPVMALIFTAAVFVAGNKTRVEDPFVGYVKISKFREDLVEDELYFSLTAPYNDKYTVELSKANLDIKLMGDGNEFPQANLHQVEIDPKKYTAAINYGVDNTVLEVNNNPAFSPVFFQVKDEYIGTSPFETKINYTGDRIEGTITNKSSYTIQSAVYIGDGLIINLGTIYSGQTLDVANLEKYNINDRSDIYGNKLIDQIARGNVNYRDQYVRNEKVDVADVDIGGNESAKVEEDTVREQEIADVAEYNSDGKEMFGLDLKSDGAGDINRKKDILYYLIEKHLSTFPDENCIIGFTERIDKACLLNEIPNKYEIFGTNAILAEARVDYSKDGKIFVPSISSMGRNENINYFGMRAGYYSFNNYPTYITEEETIMEYYLPKEDRIISIEYYALSNQDSFGGDSTSFIGNIYAQNRRTGQFDHIFTASPDNQSDVTLISSDQIRYYLTADNILTLRYEPNYIQMESNMALPKISYWKDGD